MKAEEKSMSDLLEAIKNRRSVRKYRDTPVPKELIEKVLEAGLYAASGMGRQSPVIVAVTDRKTRDRLSRINGEIMGTTNDPFYGAPVVLIVLADKTVPTHVYDGSLAIGNMLLEADSLGLGSCWIHRAKEEFEMEEWKNYLKELGAEGEYEGIGHVILGYPDTTGTKAAARKEKRVFWN